MVEPKRSIRRVVVEILIWVASCLLVVVFVRAGVDKLSSDGGWARAFVHWGYPVWFRILIGVAEIAGAVLLLLPRSAPIGAAMIAVIMLGGMFTHIRADEIRHIRSEVVPLVLSSLVFWWRYRQRRSRMREGGGLMRSEDPRVAGTSRASAK